MGRNAIDQWHKCLQKRAYPNTKEGDALARSHARSIMIKDLRRGYVHQMVVYSCKYDKEGFKDGHLHVGTRMAPFAVGSRGNNTPSEWAVVLGIKWSAEDDRECHRSIRGWYRHKDSET
jgi:hypothetical protein